MLFTYGPLPVFSPGVNGQPDDVVEGAVGGKMYQTIENARAQTSPLAIFDFLGGPLDEITSSATGQAQWVAEQTYPGGFVRFGTLIVSVYANETGPLIQQLKDAVTQATAAREAAEAAAAAAEAAEAAASSGGGLDPTKYYTKAEIDQLITGAGGNTYTIFGATAPRINPITGKPLPAGASVTWVTETGAEPVNLVQGQDTWQDGD